MSVMPPESHISIDLFSNRELAIGFWLLVGLAYSLYSKKIRQSLKQVVDCFWNVYILTPIFGLGVYVAALSYLLIEMDFWNFSQYKNITLWFICVGTYSLFQVLDINKGSKYFKETLADLLKITTIFEFIVTFYSFNFWFELVFIPFITIVALVTASLESKDEHKNISDFFNRFIEIIGLCIIIYVAYLLASNPKDFFGEGTVYDFFVPILLTIGIFPYLYLVMIYAEYERFFIRLSFKLKFKLNSDHLKRYTKHKAALSFNFHLSQLKRWERYISLHDIKSKDDINKSIKRIKLLTKRDKVNSPVSFEEGWSLYEARRYLASYGLMTHCYDHLYDEEWAASSESLKLGKDIFCNKITYHIDGNEGAVKCLTLVLDIDENKQLKEFLNKFREIGNHLFENSVSTNKELSIKIEEVEGKEDDIYETHMSEIQGRHIMIQKWNYINRKAFELRLSIAANTESFRYADTI